jgi:hypothetical protein
MGQDPKPSKRRKPSSRGLPMLPQARPAPSQSQQQGASVLSRPLQSRVPDGVDYERAVVIPGLHNALELLAGVDPDGFFKATTGDDGKSWFLAWRWQRGEWAGHYVMARVLRGEVAWGLQLLLDKVEAVRNGTRRPTRDRYGE